MIPRNVDEWMSIRQEFFNSCFSRLLFRTWVKVIKTMFIKFVDDRKLEGIAQSLADTIKI